MRTAGIFNMHTLVVMAALLVLSACSITPKTQTPQAILPDQAPDKNWQSRHAQLLKLDNWALTGKLGLRSPQKNGSARLNWQQQDQNYRLQFSDPLGRNALQLSGNSIRTTVLVPNQEPVTTTEPEKILFQQIGWEIPVNELPHWVLGSPAPNRPATYSLNSDGRLTTLKQAGWQLEYESYQPAGLLWLPRKLSMRRGDVHLKLVIHQWSIPANAPVRLPTIPAVIDNLMAYLQNL